MRQTVFKLQTSNPAQTEELAEEIGARLKGGEVIELIGDVGAGKTTFVRGLVRGMGSLDKVSSPTFTVSKVYKAKNLSLHHFDFYRLTDLGIVKSQLQEVLGEDDSVAALEWADEINEALPYERLKIKIIPLDELKREFEITSPQALDYIEVKK